jgi:antitoxin VapB
MQPTQQVSTAKVFKSGNSQEIRIPRGFRLDSDVMEIFWRGDELVLRKPRLDLREAFELLSSMPSDFMADGRDDQLPQERELWA